MMIVSPPPLSLYIHLPWCVRKCPYCDFNSHALRAALPEDPYVDALLRDLTADAPLVEGRTVQTVFLGGGTPSLFSPEAIARLLTGVRDRVALAPDAEVTLEANPGTVEVSRFRGFREAGVNRLSIGIQSFDPAKLQTLGRIHGREEATAAADAARAARFDNFNLDLMYALPDQSVEQALSDVRTALAAAPTHLSLYQLTLEPNTAFYRAPPQLPDEETIETMEKTLIGELQRAGFVQYEVSAYALAGKECRHNRNYWEFGDYLGIGAGAHAKISSHATVTRTVKVRHPEAFLHAAGSAGARASSRVVASGELPFEFVLNALRLRDGFAVSLFTQRTGLSFDCIETPTDRARERGLLVLENDSIRASALGRRFLNDLVGLFLPASASG